MKKAILILFALALPIALAGAVQPDPLGVSSDITYTSEYVFRGIREAGASFQPTVEIGAGDAYGGIWGNFPTAAEEVTLHYYGGFGFLLPGIDFASFDAGMKVYDYPDGGRDRSHEFYAGGYFTCPERPAVRASLFYFYDVDLRLHTGEAAVTYSYTLERIGLPAALDLSVSGGLQGGSRRQTESSHFYGGSVELPLFLGDNAMVTAGVHYATAEKVTFGPQERGKNLFWSLGYATFF